MALGHIYSTDGKKYPIAYLFKVGKKYLEQLPKIWRVKGLLIKQNKKLYLAQPEGIEGLPWTFLKSLDKGAEFNIDFTPRKLTPGGADEKD